MRKARPDLHLALRGAEVRAHLDAAERHETKAQEHHRAAASILRQVREQTSDTDWQQWLRRGVRMSDAQANELLMLLWSAQERYAQALRAEREIKARAGSRRLKT